MTPTDHNIKQGVETRARIVSFIRDFTEANHYPPSISEICEGVGLTRSTVHHQLSVLVELGQITKNEKSPRTIVVQEAS